MSPATEKILLVSALLLAAERADTQPLQPRSGSPAVSHRVPWAVQAVPDGDVLSVGGIELDVGVHATARSIARAIDNLRDKLGDDGARLETLASGGHRFDVARRAR